MRKILFTFISFCLAINFVYAGGIVTNTNQSAAFSRMLSRDASTDIDAVYYNPAALTKLSDGIHISLSNQTIGQTKTINNSLLNKDFVGNVSAPIFPSVYGAYKTGKWAFSFGFNPIGGGGGATYDKGLPFIELGIKALPASFASLGATGAYTYNANFEGTSVYFGFQGGVSYAINDMISVFAGARYVMAKNTYKGEITDVALASANPGMPSITNASLTAAATSYQAGADGLQTKFNSGVPKATPISAAEPTGGAVTNGLLALGYTPTQISGMNLGQAQAVFTGTATQMNTGAAYLADQAVDAEQTGSGVTPIIGVNLSLMEDRLNIGVKYEFKTNLELTNNTTTDVTTGLDPVTGAPITMFPDGAKSNADMPALLTVGAQYKATDALKIQVGYHYFFDTQVGWDNVSDIEKGLMEYSVGLEYGVTDQLFLSAGFLGGITGVKETYQSDLSYSLNSNTYAFGGGYKINDMITIQLGGYYVMYKDAMVHYTGYDQTYMKSTWGIGVGLDFAFGGK